MPPAFSIFFLGGGADAVHLQVEFLVQFAVAEDLDAVERAANEPGAAEQLFVDGRAVVEALLEIIEVDDAVDAS